MSDPKDGGPAFPAQHQYAADDPGMTLRDYFAAQVMVGLGTWSPMPYELGNRDGALQARALFAYAQADAMLEARKV